MLAYAFIFTIIFPVIWKKIRISLLKEVEGHLKLTDDVTYYLLREKLV